MANDDTCEKCQDCQSNECGTCEFEANCDFSSFNLCVCSLCYEENGYKYYKKIEQKQRDENNVKLIVNLVAVDSVDGGCDGCVFNGDYYCLSPKSMCSCSNRKRNDGRSIVWKIDYDKHKDK